MAPSRKPRGANKRLSHATEVSHDKNAENPNNSGHRKRKLSDMLGPQWSKEELERFYEAYRRYGNDWKRVASAVHNRSVEMVKALYSMNKAYLSLPEGIASVVGLTAMMTDHYNVLESDSEQESNEGTEASQKTPKRSRTKVRNLDNEGSCQRSSDNIQTQSVAPVYGFSHLKKKRSGNRQRAVGKRTPRFPVSHSFDKGISENYLLPMRNLKTRADANDVEHEIAVALTEASQIGVSPQSSRTPSRCTKAEGASPSAIWTGEKHDESERMSDKLRDGEMEEGDCEISLGSTEADNGDYPNEKSYKKELKQKGKSYNEKKPEFEESVNNHFDEIREACSGTEEGQDGGMPRGFECEVTDEGSAFGALQTLADLSLMMPLAASDTISSARLKRDNTGTVDKSKGSPLVHGAGKTVSKTSRMGKYSAREGSTNPEEKKEALELIPVMQKRKKRSSLYKISEDETNKNPQSSEPRTIQATDDVTKSVGRIKRLLYNVAQPRQGKSVRSPEKPVSSSDIQRKDNDSSLAATHLQSKNQLNLTTGVRSKHKMGIPKSRIQKDLRSSENITKDHRDLAVQPLHGEALGIKLLQEKLSNCLSWYEARRWCTYEWFYSAIDYPWFAKREFVEYLDHVGLGHVLRLTRVEWSVIRSSLGKPRRFSDQFLKEEREKLNQYRESVRKHYAELRAGTKAGLPADLARPLSVGQCVIALHPKSREIHDGSVLTVDRSRCRIQFDQPELGVEFVKDIDCMPQNPLENMPPSLTKSIDAVNKFLEYSSISRMNAQREKIMEAYINIPPNRNLENTRGPSRSSALGYALSGISKQDKSLMKVCYGQGISSSCNVVQKNGSSIVFNAQHLAESQPSIHLQIHAKEADIQAIKELTCPLDKKEALLAELRRMNEDVLKNQKDGGSSLKDSEPFKKHYAAVLFQLNEANEQVTSALSCLRGRNIYRENSTNPWMMRPMLNAGDSGSRLSLLECSTSHPQQSGSYMAEIVENSKKRAQMMVDAAIQALSDMSTGAADSVDTMEEAITYINNRLNLDDPCMPALRFPATGDSVRVTATDQDQLVAGSAYSPATSYSGAELDKPSHLTETIPSELITNCVATLFMIQKCTERQFPPADVAQVIDYAVTSLRPSCPQNLEIYAELQKCMGIIKNQILALVPT